jgi:hypothetical protein
MCFLILSLISILAGVVHFGACLFCTFGIGAFEIGLSIVAAWIGSVLVHWVGLITLGVGVASLVSIVCGGLVALSKVTCRCSWVARPFRGGVISGTLLSSSALEIMSDCVMVGYVMYFFSKKTVSETLTKIRIIKLTFQRNFRELPELPEFCNWNSDLGQGGQNLENWNSQPSPIVSSGRCHRHLLRST